MSIEPDDALERGEDHLARRGGGCASRRELNTIDPLKEEDHQMRCAGEAGRVEPAFPQVLTPHTADSGSWQIVHQSPPCWTRFVRAEADNLLVEVGHVPALSGARPS